MKKLISILLVVCMALCVVGCVDAGNDPTVTTAEVTQKPSITKTPTEPQQTVTPKPDVPTPDLNGILGEDTAGVGEELPWQD